MKTNVVELPHKPRRDEVLPALTIQRLDERGAGYATFRALVGPQRAEMTFDVHVPRAVPADVCDVRVGSCRRRRIEGTVVALIEPAIERQSPRCAHFEGTPKRPGCGGCTLQTLPIDEQRRHKQERVKREFRKAGVDAEVHPTRGVGDGWFYRNKMELSFAGDGSELGLGMHPSGYRYEVIEHDECLLMSPWLSDNIRSLTAWAREFGEPAFRAERGFWRSVVIREGKNTGERMVELVTSHLQPGSHAAAAIASDFADFTAREFGDAVTSVYWTEVRAVRGERTTRVEHHLSGRPTLAEQLRVGDAELRFEIAPSAFFQPNTMGAELLYSLVAEHVQQRGPARHLLDLYCGTGTIGLCLAHAAQHVTGMELVEAAVHNARENADRNGLSNVEFRCGDVAKLLVADAVDADVVVVDPPRAGLLPAAHDALQLVDAGRMVYVSCNPTTLARDLAALQSRWLIEDVQPVDMFPQTAHVETVVALRRLS